MTNEPVTIGTAVSGLATAVVALLIGFEIVEWTPEQTGLVLAVVTALIVAAGAVARRFSWGPVSHEAAVDAARASAPTTARARKKQA